MAKDYKKLGESIVSKLGGKDNVSKLLHCATRLRFTLKDKSKADLDGVKNIAGVMGAVSAPDGIQVIIGNDVSKVYDAIMGEFHFVTDSAVKENLDTKQNIGARLLGVLSSIVGPAIPLIMCSGLISALLIIFTNWCGLNAESTTYSILSMVGNGALYFLPILLAYTSAKRFNCDVMTSLFLGAILISPTLIDLVNAGEAITLFGLPVKAVSYSSTLIPIVLTIFVYSYVEKFVAKIVPNAIRFVFQPFVNLLIMVPVTLCVTGPIGSYCGDLLCAAMTGINNVAPWASVLVIGCLAPLLVLTGMHLALIPLVMTSFATVGYDNMLFVAFIGMNFSQFGVTLHGKGGKVRTVPLMKQTVELLQSYFTENGITPQKSPDMPLFWSGNYRKLTRSGITYIVQKYAAAAQAISTDIPATISPHVFRHTKAMHLVQANVNTIYIKDYLGHADISTTEVYARADNEAKRAALEKASLCLELPCASNWEQDADLIAWLSSLG